MLHHRHWLKVLQLVINVFALTRQLRILQSTLLIVLLLHSLSLHSSLRLLTLSLCFGGNNHIRIFHRSKCLSSMFANENFIVPERDNLLPRSVRTTAAHVNAQELAVLALQPSNRGYSVDARARSCPPEVYTSRGNAGTDKLWCWRTVP